VESTYLRRSIVTANVFILSLLRLRQIFVSPAGLMRATRVAERLRRLQQASDILQLTSRFTVLAGRLQESMTEPEVGDSDW